MVVDNTVQWLQLNLKETGLPVGFEYFTMNPNIPAGSLPLQGGLYSRLAYPDLWEWVQKQTEYLKAESEWQELAVSNGGNVPFYSKGDGSTTFRVPSLKCWVKGASSISEVSGYLAAGLPNIEGQLGLWGTEKQYSTTSGAFSTNNGAMEYGGDHSKADGLIADFDASLSNPIYGTSDTVQPSSIVGLWCVKAYGTVTNVGSTDVSAIAQGLTELETRQGDYVNKTLASDKELAVSWCMPDYSAGIALTMSTSEINFTAPKNGIIVGTLDNSNITSNLKINGIIYQQINPWASNMFIIVSKNDVISYYTQNTSSIESFPVFYPLKGVNN